MKIQSVIHGCLPDFLTLREIPGLKALRVSGGRLERGTSSVIMGLNDDPPSI